MISPLSQHIPLRSAYLCQDCESVGNSSAQCPACASTALLGLANVLDREDNSAALPTSRAYDITGGDCRWVGQCSA